MTPTPAPLPPLVIMAGTNNRAYYKPSTDALLAEIEERVKEEIAFLRGYVGKECDWDAVAEDCAEELDDLVLSLQAVRK